LLQAAKPGGVRDTVFENPTIGWKVGNSLVLSRLIGLFFCKNHAPMLRQSETDTHGAGCNSVASGAMAAMKPHRAGGSIPSVVFVKEQSNKWKIS